MRSQPAPKKLPLRVSRKSAHPSTAPRHHTPHSDRDYIRRHRTSDGRVEDCGALVGIQLHPPRATLVRERRIRDALCGSAVEASDRDNLSRLRRAVHERAPAVRAVGL